MKPRKKILVVEDSKLLRNVLRDSLASGGFDTIEAENGEEGLMMAFNARPDLIILDLMMPVMDGMELYQKLRSDAWGGSVPVIMLTATTTEKIMSWLNAEHLDFFMKDTCMMEDVVDRVRQRLGLD